jgi:hypothetical protein
VKSICSKHVHILRVPQFRLYGTWSTVYVLNTTTNAAAAAFVAVATFQDFELSLSS